MDHWTTGPLDHLTDGPPDRRAARPPAAGAGGPLLAKLGMTERVRDGSIALDDYDAQSMEVARQVGTCLFVIRIDHLIYNDYVCNPLLNDLVIGLDHEPDVDSTARDSDPSNFSD